jgi:hypothetical protein
MGRTKQDKIFDNTFEESEFELNSNVSFNLSPRVADNRDEEDKIMQLSLQTAIHDLIEASRFKEFNKLDEFADSRKLKKADINEVYDYIEGELSREYSIIDIFSELSDYFNINPNKFYSSLANGFKEELIQALDFKTGILKSKNINKLF